MKRRRPYYCGKISPIFFVLLTILVLFIVFICVKLGPILYNTTSTQTKTYATKIINQAIDTALQQKSPKYETLAVVKRNSNGEVTSVQTNTAEINVLANAITRSVIEQVEAFSDQTIYVPLGTLLGSRLFSGRGPDISFHVVPTGAVESNIQNKFESAGINQTLHQIMLEIRIEVLGLLPGYTAKTDVAAQICLAETIIIGTVPDYYTLIESGADQDLTGYIADYGPGKNGMS